MGVDVLNIIVKLVELAPRFMPPPKPPVIDYTSLIPHLPNIARIELPGTGAVSTLLPASSPSAPVEKPSLPHARSLSREPADEEELEMETTVQASLPPRDVATACMSCTRSHLATVAGLLGEALRFARSDGLASQEVAYRLNKAEQELNVMERIDLAPEKLQDMAPAEAEMAREYLPKLRALRQQVGEIGDIEGLEKSAAESSVLGTELRLRKLQVSGVDLNPVVDLARRVKAGEISMEEAKAKLKLMLPDEED